MSELQQRLLESSARSWKTLRIARLLGNGVTAGYDDRFFLRSGDNKFRLNIGGYLQLRYLENFRVSGDESIATHDEDELGFRHASI